MKITTLITSELIDKEQTSLVQSNNILNTDELYAIQAGAVCRTDEVDCSTKDYSC